MSHFPYDSSMSNTLCPIKNNRQTLLCQQIGTYLPIGYVSYQPSTRHHSDDNIFSVKIIISIIFNRAQSVWQGCVVDRRLLHWISQGGLLPLKTYVTSIWEPIVTTQHMSHVYWETTAPCFHMISNATDQKHIVFSPL